MNSISVIGRMVNDPELRAVGNTQVAKFRIVWDTHSKGEKTPHFLDVSVWGQPAEYVANFGSKGREVFVVGQLKSRKYDNKEGVSTIAWEIDSRDAKLVGGVRDDATGTPAREERTVSEAGKSAPTEDYDPFAE